MFTRFTRLLAVFAPIAAAGVMLFPASQDASALPVPTAWDDMNEYYYNLDNVPHINPRDYGYLPESYEEPWLYLRPVDKAGRLLGGWPGPVQSRALPGAASPAPQIPPPSPGKVTRITTLSALPGAGYHNDGYEDDDWFYDFYDTTGKVAKPKIKWYDW